MFSVYVEYNTAVKYTYYIKMRLVINDACMQAEMVLCKYNIFRKFIAF